jgi:hypothetical protein
MAMNPVGGTIAAAIGFFVLMKEQISEVNAELDAMGEKAAEPAFLEGIRAKEAVLREASDAAQEYYQHLQDVALGEHNITAELTAQLALQRAINAARNVSDSAGESLAQAKIKADVATGKITPEEGEAASAKVKRDAIAAAAKAKQDAQDKELATERGTLEKLDVPGDQSKALELTRQYEKEKSRRARTAADFGRDDIEQTITENQKSSDAARANLYSWYGDEKAERVIAGKEPNAGEWSTTQAGIVNNAQGENNRLKTGRGQFLADKKSEPEFNAQKIAADEARKKADETTAAQKQLADQIKALANVINATRGIENATVRTQKDTVFYNEAETLGRGLAQTKQSEQRLASPGATVSEGYEALAQAQGDTRALIQAVKDAHTENSSATSMLISVLQAQREETRRLARQVSEMHFNNQ